MFTMVGHWLDSGTGTEGYNKVFIYATVMGICCMLLSGILAKICSKKAKA